MPDWTIKTPSGSLIVSSGTINLTSNSIVLPVNPNDAMDKSTALSIPLPIPLSYPMIVSYGIENRTLTVQGVIWVNGQNSSYLEDTYLIPLRNVVYRVVTIDAGASNKRYNGDYILQEFTYHEVAGFINYFTYSMTLLPYSIQVVI